MLGGAYHNRRAWSSLRRSSARDGDNPDRQGVSSSEEDTPPLDEDFPSSLPNYVQFNRRHGLPVLPSPSEPRGVPLFQVTRQSAESSLMAAAEALCRCSDVGDVGELNSEKCPANGVFMARPSSRPGSLALSYVDHLLKSGRGEPNSGTPFFRIVHTLVFDLRPSGEEPRTSAVRAALQMSASSDTDEGATNAGRGRQQRNEIPGDVSVLSGFAFSRHPQSRLDCAASLDELVRRTDFLSSPIPLEFLPSESAIAESLEDQCDGVLERVDSMMRQRQDPLAHEVTTFDVWWEPTEFEQPTLLSAVSRRARTAGPERRTYIQVGDEEYLSPGVISLTGGRRMHRLCSALLSSVDLLDCSVSDEGDLSWQEVHNRLRPIRLALRGCAISGPARAVVVSDEEVELLCVTFQEFRVVRITGFDEVPDALNSFEIKPRLVVLDLMGNELTDRAATAIASLLKDPDCVMVSLDISENRLSICGVRELADAVCGRNGVSLLRRLHVDPQRDSRNNERGRRRDGIVSLNFGGTASGPIQSSRSSDASEITKEAARIRACLERKDFFSGLGPVERTSTGPLHFSGVSVTAPGRLWKGWVPYSAGPALLAEELARGAHSARCVFFVCPEVPYSLCLCAQSVLANQNMSTPYVLTFHRHHDGFVLSDDRGPDMTKSGACHYPVSLRALAAWRVAGTIATATATEFEKQQESLANVSDIEAEIIVGVEALVDLWGERDGDDYLSQKHCRATRETAPVLTDSDRQVCSSLKSSVFTSIHALYAQWRSGFLTEYDPR